MAEADTRKFDSASDPAHRRQIVLNTWVTLLLLWGGGQVVAVGGVFGDGRKAVVSEEAATLSEPAEERGFPSQVFA
jgi:hypothetical protein